MQHLTSIHKMRQTYMPAIFSLSLASCLIGAFAFSVDREEFQHKRGNSRSSFLAAGSNHMANSFWSTGRGAMKEENRAYRGETFGSAYRDTDKKSAKQYRNSRDQLDSLYDSRNYVDEGTSQYSDVAKRPRTKDDFKSRKNSQKYNYYSRATHVREPEGVSEDTKETDEEEGHTNTATGKGVRRFYERQYQNYGSNNRQRFFDRNIEDSGRSGYARRDIGYDYPFRNGFGEEQIYYYYYDPDIDSLSLGFNSHSPQNVDDHRIDDDNIMMYESHDDNSDRPPKKEHSKEFETAKSRISKDSNEKNEDKKELANQKNLKKMHETDSDAEEKITRTSGKNEINHTTSGIITTKGPQDTEGGTSDAKEDQTTEKDHVDQKPIPSSFTSSPTLRNNNEMKKEQHKLEESLQNQVDDYQQRKPDIIPYRSSVSNLDQNETSASNDSANRANSMPHEDKQFSFATTTLNPTVEKKTSHVIESDSHSGDKVKEKSHDADSFEKKTLRTSAIPQIVDSNDKQPTTDRKKSNSMRGKENRSDKKDTPSMENIKKKDQLTVDNKSKAQSDINTKALKTSSTGAASPNISMDSQTRNAQKSMDNSNDTATLKSKEQSGNSSMDINNTKAELVSKVKHKNLTEGGSKVIASHETKDVENNAKSDISRNLASNSTNVSVKSEPSKQRPSKIRDDNTMHEQANSTESEKKIQNSSLIHENHKDFKDQASNKGEKTENTKHTSTEKIVASSQSNSQIPTQETTQSSIESNKTITDNVTTSTDTVKSHVQDNEEDGINLSHSPPTNVSPGERIHPNSRDNATNSLYNETLTNKTNNLNKEGDSLDNESEVVKVNTSALPVDLTRNKTAKKKGEDANSSQTKIPSKRWPVGVPYKKGINSPASISHEDNRGNISDQINETYDENNMKTDQSMRTTVGVPKNDDVGSMDHQNATSGSTADTLRKVNTSNHNLKEKQLPQENISSSIAVDNTSSQINNTPTTKTVMITERNSKQIQIDAMAKRFSAFLKTESVKESGKSVEESKEVKPTISSFLHNDTETPSQNKQDNASSDNVTQNETTKTSANTTQVPKISPYKSNHGNESNTPSIHKERENSNASSETEINSLPVTKGKNTQALRKDTSDQTLTKSPSVSNDTISISAAASAPQPDVATNDQVVNSSMVQSQSHKTGENTALINKSTANTSQADTKKSNAFPQKELKAKDQQDGKTNVASTGQTTSRSLLSTPRIQIENIVSPNNSSTFTVNNTTRNHTVTPETKMADKHYVAYSTPVTKNGSTTSGNASEEHNGTERVSKLKTDVNKRNDSEKSKDDGQETGHLNDTRQSDDSRMEQINGTDYVELKIPEVSAYMIQDFSLELAKPVVEEPTSLQDSPVQTLSDSENDTKAEDCPTAPHCSSLPQAQPPPRSQAAISAVLTSHFGPTKERIIPFDLELLDLADNYDNTTGMFICTIPGTYVISVYLMSHPGAKVNARVFINDRPVAALWADDSKNAGFYPSSSIQTVVQLGFGDQVYVMLVDGGYGDSWVHANYNVFTIFLLYEQVFK